MSNASRVVILGLLCALPLVSFAQLYKYVDEEGNVHFTDQPQSIPPQYRNGVGRARGPREQQPAIERETSGAGGDAATAQELEAAARQAAGEGRIGLAVEQRRAALRLRERIEGPDAYAMVRRHVALAELLKRQGDIRGAGEHLKTAAIIAARTRGPDSPAATVHFRDYLSVLNATGRSQEARTLEPRGAAGLLGPPASEPEGDEEEAAAEPGEAGTKKQTESPASPGPIDTQALLEQLRESGLLP